MEEIISAAAAHFGKQVVSIRPLGNGLIHQTYHVRYANAAEIVLQRINSNVFPEPEQLVKNYLVLFDYLQRTGSSQVLPPPVATTSGNVGFTDEDGEYWRATQFIKSKTINEPENAASVYEAASCFAKFTRAVAGIDFSKLFSVLPGFHDLAARFEQFEQSILNAQLFRLMRATHVISELRSQTMLLEQYQIMIRSADFPNRVMHHDCKISNVLFKEDLSEAICPVDLDTLMPGKYFSDIGDMIRTMCCTVDENSTRWEEIDVNTAYYAAVIDGYLDGMGDAITKAERSRIHMSGQIMIFMQCLRFVTDFLNNDIYYQTTYPEQNLNRALNQLILLEKLQAFLLLQNG